MTNWYIEVVERSTKKVESRTGPHPERKAEKIADGRRINLNHEKYFVRVVREEPHDEDPARYVADYDRLRHEARVYRQLRRRDQERLRELRAQKAFDVEDERRLRDSIRNYSAAATKADNQARAIISKRIIKANRRSKGS